MIDSIGLKIFNLPVTTFGLKRFNWEQKKYSRLPTFYFKSKKETPNLTAFFTPKGSQICVEGSLPKVIFGHNAKLPNQAEVNEGLQFISDFVEANSGLPFDMKNAVVSRADYAVDLQVSEEQTLNMVKILAQKSLDNKDKLFYNGSTLYFNSKDRSKSDSIRIYPKLKQVLSSRNPSSEAVENAKGKLRIERTLKKNAIHSLIKKLGLLDRKAKTLLTQGVSDFVMAETLDLLDYDELEIATDSVLIKLLQRFPAKQAMSLYGFLEMIRIYGEQFYKDTSHDYSKRTYFKQIAKLKEAGFR